MNYSHSFSVIINVNTTELLLCKSFMSCLDNHDVLPVISYLTGVAEKSLGYEALAIVLLILLLPLTFYLLNLLCEELLIPTLNVLCDKLKLSDEIANSTLLAVGASLPQFTSSIISIFITYTNIGIGLSIGSNFFNSLCILSTVLFNAKHGAVYLKDRIFLRDIMFYIASLIILVFALKGHGSLIDIFNGHSGNCLVITWQGTLLLLSVWMVYLLVCTYYPQMVACCCPSKYSNGGELDYHLPPCHFSLGILTL